MSVVESLKNQIIEGKLSGAIALITCVLLWNVATYFSDNLDKHAELSIVVSIAFVVLYILVKTYEILTKKDSMAARAVKKHLELDTDITKISKDSLESLAKEAEKL